MSRCVFPFFPHQAYPRFQISKEIAFFDTRSRAGTGHAATVNPPFNFREPEPHDLFDFVERHLPVQYIPPYVWTASFRYAPILLLSDRFQFRPLP